MKDRFPKWFFLYFILQKFYLWLGVPICIFYSLLGFYFVFSYNTLYSYTYAFGWLAAATLPILWRRHAAKKRDATLQDVLNAVKATGYFNPEPKFEATSFWQSMYFGIDIRQGTMLYIQIFPGGVMDVIGYDIHNFTRTVVEGSTLRVYSKYVSKPRITLNIFRGDASNMANCMHAMAEKGYHYDIDFPAVIQNKRADWERISKVPVLEIY